MCMMGCIRTVTPHVQNVDHGDASISLLVSPIGGCMADHDVQSRLYTRRRESVSAARQDARAILSGWACGHLSDDVALVVTELVTNALTHAHLPCDRRIAVTYRHTRSHLRVCVSDPGRGLPTRRAGGLDDEHGHGLVLVDALADRWGVARRTVGKIVWTLFLIQPTSPERWTP